MKDSDLYEIVSQALEDMKERGFDTTPQKVNLAELRRLTGIPRGKLRRMKKHGFVPCPHGNTGRTPANAGEMIAYSGTVDEYLRSGIRNSAVIFKNIKNLGFTGGESTVRNYVSKHRHLLPAVRALVPAGENRGRRYTTGPGEMFQMDWGFVEVEDTTGETYKSACFAMVCHHCGERFLEFFPNASQENLFIGMIHAFDVMGMPETVLTDNMASVSNKRDAMGKPIFNANYDAFQNLLGFQTKLCKVAHPFTKGKVERLVRYMKENFIAGRQFLNVNDLNNQAYAWCQEANSKVVSGTGVIPGEVHDTEGLIEISKDAPALLPYVAPVRKVSFDGYVSYEGRRYGVPARCDKTQVRVKRDHEHLYIIDPDDGSVVVEHIVDWSRVPHNCEGQWSLVDPDMPIENPTTKVKARIKILDSNEDSLFKDFDNFKEDDKA